MDGILLGDIQRKRFSVRHPQFASGVRMCMFSVGEGTTASLLRQVQRWRLKLKFAVLYIGGHDLVNSQPPDVIVGNILVRWVFLTSYSC